jgi:hypothetical protein
VDAKTEELRDAHDALAEVYASRLAHVMDELPADRAVLGLFCDLVLGSGAGSTVGDIGCGTGRPAPFLAGRGLTLGTGFDVYWLSPAQLEQYVTDAGFSVTFWAGRTADPGEKQPQGYLIARRR